MSRFEARTSRPLQVKQQPQPDGRNGDGGRARDVLAPWGLRFYCASRQADECPVDLNGGRKLVRWCGGPTASPSSRPPSTSGSHATRQRVRCGHSCSEPPNSTSSFLNIRVANVQEIYEDWSAKGAQLLTPPVDHGVELRCYLRDPDGHLIEVGQANREFLKERGLLE